MASSGYEKDKIHVLMKKLLSGPETPESFFSFPGYRYVDLYEKAGGISAELARCGSDKKPVCLFSENHFVIAATLLAVLGGGPPVVIPHSLSKSVFDQLHDITGFDTVITDCRDCFHEKVKTIVPGSLEGQKGIKGQGHDMDPDRVWGHLFTGGTTGNPRLWPKTVRNLLSEACYITDRYGFSKDDRVLATVPPYHIYGLLYSVLSPLVASCSVISQIPSFPGEINSALKEKKATILVSVPAHYRALKSNMKKTRDLRIAFSSAGPLPRPDGEAFTHRSGVDVIEVYGSTETGGIATRCRAKGEDTMRPYGCIDWKIKGETLLIRSDFLAPGLTADPDGFYKMSDRVVPAGDHGFVVKGRSDSVVKVGGKRVELEDLKCAILTIDGVTNVCLLTRPVESGRENEIFALVEGDVDRPDIVQGLTGLIEPHMRPRVIKVVPKIPMAPTGKIDRKTIESFFENFL